MREMTSEEMEQALRRCNWATICSVTPHGYPYAIEATPFRMDGCHCFMINPRGVTWENMRENPHVFLKYTLTNADLSLWAGVSCFGKGEFVIDEAALREGWRLLGEVMGTDYSRAANSFARLKDRSPLFRVEVVKTTGRCSAAKGAPLDLDAFRAAPATISGATV